MAADGFAFSMQQQEHHQWCWVATAVSVAAYYEPNGTWEQCFWVDDQFGTTNCCVAGDQPHCNRPGVHMFVLSRVGHLDRAEAGAAPITPTITAEIAARRPLTTAIRWSDGKVHFPLINGYFDVIISLNPYLTERWLSVQDPIYGPSTMPYETFRTKYKGQGTWFYTYITK